MENYDIVVFSLRPFLGKIIGKSSVLLADILGRIENSISQIPGTLFFHVQVAILELDGLVGRWGHAGIIQQLVRGIKPGEISNFAQNHGSHAQDQSWNSGNGRMKLTHKGLEPFFDFSDFSIQFPDKADSMLQFNYLHFAGKVS